MFQEFFFNYLTPLIIVDKNTLLVSEANKKFCELTGFEYELIKNLDINKLFPNLNFAKIDTTDDLDLSTFLVKSNNEQILADIKLRAFTSGDNYYYGISIKNSKKRSEINETNNKKEINFENLKYIGKIEFFNYLLSSLPVLIIALDSNFNIKFWNKECEVVLGFKSDEILNSKSFKDLFNDVNDFERLLHHSPNFLSVRNLETELKAKSGEIRTLSWSSLSETNFLPGGYIWLVGNDVTERNKMAFLLIEEEKKYRNLFQKASDYMLMLNFDFKIIDVNEAFLKGFGFKYEDIINKPVESIVAIESIPILRANLQRVVNGEEVSEYDVQARKAFSDIEWLEIKNRLISIDDKKIGIEIIARNITHRKLIQDALRLNQLFLKRLIDNLPVAVFVKDFHTWQYMLWNKTAEKIFGYSFIEVLERTDYDIYDIKRAEFLRKIDMEVFESKAPYTFIDEYVTRDGDKLLYLNVTIIPVFDEIGSPQHLLVITEDITERKLAEDALRESEEKYRLISENMRDMICLHERDGSFCYISPSANEVLNYDAKELEHKRIDDIVYEEDLLLVKDNFRAIFENEKDYSTVRFRVYKKNGEITWVESTLQPIRTQENTVSKILCVSTDVTEKIKSNEIRQQLQNELNRLSQVAKQTTSSVIITDIEGKVVWVNDAFTKLTGYTFEEAKGKDPRQLLQGPEIGQQISTFIKERIKSSYSLDLRTYNFTKSRRGFWTDLRVDPMFDADGNHIGYISVENDITDKVEYEIQLRNAKEKAEESNRLKSHFLANMSHEIRTPMIGILGYADILRESIVDEELKEMAERIFVNGERLMETINLIIDLSRIETNRLEMDLRKLNVVTVAEDVVKLFEKSAQMKNLDVKLNTTSDEIYALLDDRMFRGVLNNLVNNAIKFTEKGEVTLSIDTFFENVEGEKKEFIKIIVKDTGIGIPKDKISIIFDEFRQVSEGHNRKYEGTGLGLTIAKKFTELMKGKIYCESVFGQGTEFILTFQRIY